MLLDRIIAGLTRKGVAPLVRALYRPRVEGLDNVPARGPVILASNHLSFCDSVFVPLAVLGPPVRREVAFIGKVEYFRGSRPDQRLVTAFMRAMGTVPVDRTGGRAALAAMATSERLLREGRVFGIYPEGTRSPDGRLYRGRTGAARLALATGAPVVPCAVIGTDRVQPNGAPLPRPPWKSGRPTVRFGPPVPIGPRPTRRNDSAVLRAVTDDIVTAIAELSGQEYVNTYAPAHPDAA